MAQEQKGNGLRTTDRVALVVVAIFAVVVAFWAFSFVVGAIWWVVKVAIVVALVWLVMRFLVGRRH